MGQEAPDRWPTAPYGTPEYAAGMSKFMREDMNDISKQLTKLPMHGGRPTAIIPRDMQEVYQLAQTIVFANMAPKDFKSAEAVMIAIMRGMEIGLTPFAALDKICVINNRATVWGDGALGIVRASGLCMFIQESIEGEGDERTAVCATQRKGEPAAVIRRFSIADAKKAGLWDDRPMVDGKPNKSPWYRYEDRMLAMRARGFCLRDTYPDALGGLYLREEMPYEPEDEPHVVDGLTKLANAALGGRRRGRPPKVAEIEHKIPVDDEMPPTPSEARAMKYTPAPGQASAELQTVLKDALAGRSAEPYATMGQKPADDDPYNDHKRVAAAYASQKPAIEPVVRTPAESYNIDRLCLEMTEACRQARESDAKFGNGLDVLELAETNLIDANLAHMSKADEQRLRDILVSTEADLS